VQHVTHSGPEVFFKTCVAMKFVDDDDDDDDEAIPDTSTVNRATAVSVTSPRPWIDELVSVGRWQV